jgi:carbon monoxide dehydrogenase subunit G
MEMSGEQIIPATQAQTWDALNDPEILKACVPGCESITKTAENEYVVLMTARIGPVSAKFKGKLALSDLDPPNSYSIAFEGQGGVAGFGKGGAKVQLAPDTAAGGNTKLTYQVKANVGGKLAQIGSRLVDAAAKKLAVEFFDAFNAKVASQHPDHGSPGGGAGHGHDDHHDDGHPGPVADNPDKPKVDDATLRFLAAGCLVVFVVSLLALF